MKKELYATAMAAVMLTLAGCAGNESDMTGTQAVTGEASADNEVMSLAESIAESMFESRMADMTETTAESTAAVTIPKPAETTEEVTAAEVTENSKSISHTFFRQSEDESRTLVIDSDVFPYDCEEIEICVDTEYPYYNDIEPYDCIDLSNIKYYTNLKRLVISDNNAQTGGIVEVVNAGGAAELENFEELELARVRWWSEDWLSGIRPLKYLSIMQCSSYDGRFLENLSQVESLYLYSCSINDLSFLNGMSSLTDLHMEWLELSNASFDSLEENNSIKRLDFIGNSEYNGDGKYALTDIIGIAKFKGLEYLYVAEEHLDDPRQQCESIQADMPECEDFYYYGG